jgi:hypothetical protein
VVFDAEAVFEGPEDRLDPLDDPGDRRRVAGFVLAWRAQHRGAVVVGEVLGERPAGVALVADHHLAAAQADWEQPQRDVAFLLVGGGQTPISHSIVSGSRVRRFQ